MTEIFLVDDSRMMRNAIKHLIECEPNFKVCGEAGSAEDALKALGHLKPDVVLVDISLGGNQNGIQLISDIRARGHAFPILTISLHEEALYAKTVFKVGAQGYLTKQDAPEKIVRAIKSVVSGRKEFFALKPLLQQV